MKLYIHWTNFPTLLLLISLNAWANTWCIFHLPSHISNSTMYIFNKTYEFLFTLQWSLIPVEAFVGVGGSLVHCALTTNVCLHLLTCVVFISKDLLWNFWLFYLIKISDCLITKTVAIKNSPKTVKLIQKVLVLRKEIHTPVKDSYYL